MDVMGISDLMFDKPVVVFNIGLPGTYTYRNKLYTNNKEKAVEFIKEWLFEQKNS